MSEHTKGPWCAKIITFDGDYQIITGAPQKGIYQICRVRQVNGNEEQTKANVALIAAAPEMLAALRFSLDVFTRERVRKGRTEEGFRESKLKSVIAKATGKEES